MVQLVAPSLSPTPPSPTVPNPPPLHSKLPLATSLELSDPIGTLGRAADGGGVLEAFRVASQATEGATSLLIAKLDDGELAIKMSSLSSRVACADSSSTLDQLHLVAASSTSCGAYATITPTSNERVQVQLRTQRTRPTASRTPPAVCAARVMPRS